MGRILFFLPLLLSLSTFGQSVKYVSDTDQSLTFKTILLAPLVDNVSGIYASALNDTLKNSVEASHQWNTVPTGANTPSPEYFETSTDAVKSITSKASADALVTGRVSKGPNGVTIKVSLFSGKDGLPIGAETLSNYPGFEIKDLKLQLANLVKRLRAKLPFQASVMSRKAQLVTLNIGSAAGVRPGVEATVIQVIKVNRHPKFGFIVSTDNLVLGKIQINKVDDFLSFGTITTEREPNVISAGNKVSLGNAIQYPNSNVMSDGKLVTELGDRADNQMAFGDHPQEWVPQTPPSFGKVGILFGLGTYTIGNGLSSGGISSTSSATPSLHLNGELWLNPNWSVGFNIRDYVSSVSNGLTGSNPSTLSASLAKTSLNVSRSFLITDEFFGPKVETGVGYSTASSFIDNSTPTAYESTTYSGLYIHLAGSMPLGESAERFPYFLGGRFDYFFNPSESESPTNSGSSSGVQVNSFSVYLEKRFTERLNWHGEVMFDSLTSNFSGTGSRSVQNSSTSQSLMTFAFGVEFLF